MHPLLMALAASAAIKKGQDRKSQIEIERQERKEERDYRKKVLDVQMANAKNKQASAAFKQSVLDMFAQYGLSQGQQGGMPEQEAQQASGGMVGTAPQEVFGPQSLLDQLVTRGQPQTQVQPKRNIRGLLTDPGFLAMSVASGAGDFTPVAKFISSQARGIPVTFSVKGDTYEGRWNPLQKKWTVPPVVKKEISGTPIAARTAEGTFQYILNPVTGEMQPARVGQTQGAFPVAPGEKRLPPKAISSMARGKIGVLKTMEENFDLLIKEFKPEYAGLKGVAKSLKLDASGMAPGIDADPDYAAWRMLFENLRGMERHESFGAAFTATEKAAFKKMFASTTRHPENFIAELKAFQDLIKRKKANIEVTSTSSMEEIRDSVTIDRGSKGKPEKKRLRFNKEGVLIQ